MNYSAILKFRLIFALIALLTILLPSDIFGETKIIIAYGDSLTEGCGNEVSTCGVTPRPGDINYDYDNQLQALLSSANHDYVVNNFGQGGEQTSDALSYPYRFEEALNNSCNVGSEFILIMEGTNDLLQSKNPHDIKFNLGVMIDKSLERGLIPLVATIPPDATPGHEYKGIPEMNSLIRQLVDEKKLEGKDVLLVEMYDQLAQDWSAYTNPRSCYSVFNPDDQLHPNETGFNAIGTIWYDSLEGLLPNKKVPWLILLLNKTD